MKLVHDINAQAVGAIKDGLNALSNSLLEINAIVGDSSSRIHVDNGVLRINGTTTHSEKLGVGVNRVSDGVCLETSGAVKFQGKKFEVGNGVPTHGTYNAGDVVWNDAPKPNGNLGWICVQTGAPGQWQPFGNIGS
jgi:hypothetical protein